jgi:hypothetical protein
MTLYGFFVPVIALAVAGVGTLSIHRASKRLDARIAVESRSRHPAG